MQCRTGRSSPLTPSAFNAALEQKRFTSKKADLPFVQGCYEQAFREKIGEAVILEYAGLWWDDAQVRLLIDVLNSGACSKLEALDISYNLASEALLQPLIELVRGDKLPSLRELVIVGNERLWPAEQHTAGKAQLSDVCAQFNIRLSTLSYGEQLSEKEREELREKALAEKRRIAERDRMYEIGRLNNEARLRMDDRRRRNPPFSQHQSEMLWRELKSLVQEMPEGASVAPVGDDIFRWQGNIMGPKDSPYEGGVFFFTINFEANFPFAPPRVRFDTKIYHPNIMQDGPSDYLQAETLASVMFRGHGPFTIKEGLNRLITLLREPCWGLESGIFINSKMARELPSEFEQTAKSWTLRYAM